MRLTRSIGKQCALLLIVIGARTGWGNESDSPSDSLVAHLPHGAIASVELAKLEPLIARIENSAGLQAVLQSPQWREILKQDQVQKALAGKALAEGQLGMSLWQFAKTYLGDRAVLGIYPPSQPGGPPDGVVIIRVKEAASLETLWQRMTPLLPLAGNKLKVGEYEGGGRLITVDDGHQLITRDRWIVLCKVKSLLDQTLQSLKDKSQTETKLTDTPAWKTMASQMGTSHEVQLCVNIAGLTELAGHRFIPSKLDNGVLSLLLGGYVELASSSPYLGSTLDFGENGFTLRSSVAGDAKQLDAAHRPFVLEGNAVPQASVPPINNPLNGFSLTRDFAGWYRNREARLDAKLLPGFDKFETGLATFLSGRDFGNDVLPTLGQRLTVVTAPQSFEHLKGKPGVQLPGFAVLFDLAKPDEAKDLLNLLFQSVVLVSNFQAAQEGRQPFVLSSESYRDIQIAFAKYLKQPEGATLPISLNFQPASARVGNRFVFATNVAMCRQLIDTLQAEAAAPKTPNAEAGTQSDAVRDVYFDLSPAVAADLLEANSAILQAQSLQQGKSSEQSIAELDALLKLLRQLKPVTFTSTRRADRWELELQGGWK